MSEPREGANPAARSLSPQEIRSLGSPIAQVAELVNAWLPHLHAEIVTAEQWAPPLVAHTAIGGGARRLPGGAQAVVNYEVTGVLPDGDASAAAEQEGIPDGRVIYRARVDVAIHYTIPGAETFTDEQVEAFCGLYGTVAAHPYARAALTSLTASLGVPPLIIQTLHIPG